VTEWLECSPCTASPVFNTACVRGNGEMGKVKGGYLRVKGTPWSLAIHFSLLMNEFLSGTLKYHSKPPKTSDQSHCMCFNWYHSVFPIIEWRRLWPASDIKEGTDNWAWESPNWPIRARAGRNLISVTKHGHFESSTTTSIYSQLCLFYLWDDKSIVTLLEV